MHLSRRQAIAYLAVAAIVAAVGGRSLLASRTANSSSATLLSALPAAAELGPASSAAPTAQASAQELVAYACGAVAHPGVYRLLPGARIADLLALAGGATARADLTAVNLAAKVADGQQVVVPTKTGAAAQAQASAAGAQAGAGTGTGGGASTCGGASATAGTTPLVNLNTATAAELDTLQGVGLVTAQKIIDYRTANGGFKSIDELKNVPGIGDVRFAAIKDSVTL